jgi:molybdenum ABC transporter molybdate-binding protein
MHKKVLSVLLLCLILVATACTPQATATLAPTQPPAAPAATQAPAAPTAAPTAVPTAAPTLAPTAPPAAASGTLTVFAAASLTDSFNEIGKLFEAAHPGVKVTFSYAGSQSLAQQLDQGAPADVFASASKSYMDAEVKSGRVDQPTAQTFARNRLTVIYPAANPAGLKTLQDLAKPGVKLVLEDKSVPAGQYSLTFFDNAVKDKSFDPKYKDNVLKNVVSYEDNVKSVLTKVTLGEADAGIVYTTDAATDKAGKIAQIAIPDSLNVIASYPIAPIKDSANPDLAKAFVALVTGADGQAVLAKYGFIPPPAAATSSSTGGALTITDALGRTVSFDKAPQRIALAGKALFMIADAIYTFPDAGSRVVALGNTKQGSYTFIPMIDPTFAQKTQFAQDAGADQIAAAHPDAVIMKSVNQSSLGKAVEALKIPVVYVDFETPDQYVRDLKTLGTLFQNDARAQAVSAFFQSGTDKVTKATAALTDAQKPKTLILYYNATGGNVAFNVPPLSFIQTTMVQDAGGAPVWKDANLGNNWTKVTLEQIAAWNPDVVFIVAYFNPVGDVVKQLKADPQWQALSAVKNNKIYGFATDVYSWDEPDPRWILGLTWMAGKLHPELFPGLDMKAEAQTFYQTLYGMDAASFQKNIVPTFAGDIP